MRVTDLDAQIPDQIGHAFGYYDYGEEIGMDSFFRSKDAVADYIAYKLPGQKLGFGASMELVKALFHSMSLKEIFRMGVAISKGGTSLEDRMKKAKKPCIFVGMVCVPEAFQGLGYMRKVMELAYAEGNRLQVPVILETDAKSKCDKYRHLGMQLEGIRDLGAYGKMYDMIKYPD